MAAGAETLQDVQDVGGGRLIAFVKDADGNLVGLLQDPSADATSGAWPSIRMHPH